MAARVVGCVDAGLSPAVLGRSSQAQAYTAQCVTRSGLAVSPSPRSGVVEANQPNRASAAVKTPEPSSAEGLVTALPCSNKSTAKSKSIPNRPNAQVLLPATTQTNGTALAKSAASAAIVESVHPLEWRRVIVDGGTQRVCERGTHSDPCASSSFSSLTFNSFFSFFSWFDEIDRSVVRGSTLDGISCVGIAYVVIAFVYLPWCSCCPQSSPFIPHPRPRCVATSGRCRTCSDMCLPRVNPRPLLFKHFCLWL